MLKKCLGGTLFFSFLISFFMLPAFAGKDKDKAPSSEEEEMIVEEEGPLVEEESAPVVSIWEEFPPDIKVGKWGTEIRITVTPNPEMGEKELAAVQSVKLESEKGDYLGFKTYTPEETAKVAEFMFDPAVLQIDKAKITVSSQTAGNWEKMVSLIEEPPAFVPAEDVGAGLKPTPTTSSPDASEEKKGAPKKKGWFW